MVSPYSFFRVHWKGQWVCYFRVQWVCYFICLLFAGWSGKGLGAAEQGIVDPIEAAEVRDKLDMRKGIGIDLKDPFEQFRKSKAAGFIQRMRARDDGSTAEPPPTSSK